MSSSHAAVPRIAFGILSSIALTSALAGPSEAQTFTIGTGVTDTAAKTLSGTQSGTIDAGGKLSISGSTNAITWNGTASTVVITNSGIVEQLGSGRAFNAPSSASGTRNLTFTNNAGASLIASANDAFRIDTALTSGVITIENSGLIRAGGSGFTGLGQALDLRSIAATSGVTVTITNNVTGIIESYTDDAIRAAQNSIIHNYGTIRSGIEGVAAPNSGSGSADGIDAGARTGVVVTNESTGVISGARHGITADTDITVVNYGSITGRNGSGVGSDGNGTVTNYGTITGAYAGVGNIFLDGGAASINGDGDGVDIDKIGTINNYGIIQGTGAGGVDSGGQPNGSEGIAMGGGTINNYAGALISGAKRGILIDDGSEGDGVGAVTITNAGTIEGLAGAAIKVVGPYANSIANSGIIRGDGSEATIIMGVGNDTVTNSGTIIGSIDLGGGTNTLSNLAAGRLIAGTALSVGAGNTLTNAGTLAPGGAGSIVTTAVTGNLSQTATGVLAIDLDAASNSADRVNVSGTAALSGQVQIAMQSLAITSGQVTILSATNGTTANGLALNFAGSGPVVQAELVYPNANDVVVAYSISFAPTNAGLNGNQLALGQHINAAVSAGGTGIQPITDALLNVTTNSDYRSALDQLSPEVYAQSAASTLFAATNFGNALMSCRAKDAAYVAVSEEECVWANVSGSNFEQDRTGSNIGYGEQAWRFAGGAQVKLAPGFTFGLAGGVEQSTSDTGGYARTDGDRFFGGATLKHNAGPWLFAAAIYGGQAAYDTDRRADFGGLVSSMHGSQDVANLSGRLRVAYQFGSTSLYAKPMADLEVAQLWLGSFTETGGAVALSVASSEETFARFAPAIEIGGEMGVSKGLTARPFVRLGASILSADEISVVSSFAGLPSYIGAFKTSAAMDQVQGTISAGVDLLAISGGALKLYYDGSFGETTEQHAFGGKASFNF